MSESAVIYKVRPGGADATPRVAGRAGWSRCAAAYGRNRRLCVPGEQLVGTFGRVTGGWLVRERSPGREAGLRESILHAAWRKAGAKALTVSGRDGHRYRIIYPGRPADGAGPDFRDAVLLRDDGARVHGDVEVHIRSGDWHGHGHDRAYNGVVLHVALEETGAPAKTLSGIRIPLLLLRRSLVDDSVPAAEAVENKPQEPADVMSAAPLPFLDMAAAGDEWFRNRVNGSLMQISFSGGDQALWEGALECLGYPANKKGFWQVAARLNWETVAKSLHDTSPVSLTALFAWAGGFGAKPADAPRLGGSAPDWSPRHGRPANHPETRLRAAAVWAYRWYSSGGPVRTFEDAVRKANKPHELLSVFTVPAPPDKISPLGRARAADAVVNQLLPAVHALALNRGDTRLAARAKRLFDAHPPLQQNSVTREASRMLRTRSRDATPHTAREQQGLIHIYRMATARQQPDRQLPLL